jgi:pimeloyl-ACP methyl ester carboxylesterase
VDVTLDGLRFSYLEWGPADAPPLVLLHGFTGHALTWRRLAEALPERHVYALDQRGHGDSDWAPVYGARHMVRDIELFTEATDVRRFELLGLSMGGINAIAFAGSHPEQVDRLVIVDIGPEIDRAGLTRIGAGVRQSDVFADEDAAFAQARAGNPIPRDEVLRERVVHNLKPAEGGGLTFKWDKALRDGTAVRDDYSPEELWRLWDAIDAPTLVVRGELSDILSPEIAHQMVQRNTNAKLAVVPGSGHTVPLDQPELFEATVRAFLLGG